MALNINGTTGISGVDGSASAPALQGTDSNTGINFASDTVNINTGGTTKATIDSVGSLLMGTNSSSGFDSFGSNSGGIILDNVNSSNTLLLATHDTAKFFYGVDASVAYLWCGTNHPIKMATNNTERLRISSDGTFDVMNSSYAYFQSNSTTTSSLTLKKSASGADSISYLQCRDSSNGLKLAILGNGNVQNANNSYGSFSDVKLKENIVDANSQWNDIKAVKVRNFNFKDDSAKTKMLGVVAQEIESISSGLVSESIDRNPDTGEDLGTKTKAVKYSILYMKAIKCLQEAQARIETLETKVAALEAG